MLVACSGNTHTPGAGNNSKVVGTTTAEHNHGADMPAAYHEFQVFGEKTIFLSHYPMFSSIHAYQVIAEAKLIADGVDPAGLLHAFRRAHPNVSVSLSPSKRNASIVRQRDDWVLPLELVRGGSFNTDMWVPGGVGFDDATKRHYLATNVTVEVTKVVRMQLLYPDTEPSKALTYLWFGEGDDQYLAHRLDRYPDFDQIVRVHTTGAPPPSGSVAVVAFANRRNAQKDRLLPGQMIVGATVGTSTPVTVKVLAELNDDTVDIQQ